MINSADIWGDVMYRKAGAEDCAQIYDLICDMEETKLPFDKFCEIFYNQLNDEHYFCLVYDQGESVIAVLNLRFEEQLHHSAYIAEIMEFVVAPGNRNRGVGKAMLEEANRIAIKHGCIQIEVACNQLRKDTHRFYIREGMKNYHYRFSKPLTGIMDAENSIGR